VIDHMTWRRGEGNQIPTLPLCNLCNLLCDSGQHVTRCNELISVTDFIHSFTFHDDNSFVYEVLLLSGV